MAVSGGLASVLMIAATLSHPISYNGADIQHDPVNVKGFASGIGIFLFAFGGAQGFSTVQFDMENRSKFPNAVIIAFCSKKFNL